MQETLDINMKTQHQEILEILKKTPRGMNSFAWRTSYIQLPVRIRELKDMGYIIKSRRNADRSVNYILLGEVSKNPSERIVAPQKGIADVIREGMDNQVRVEKNGRIFWEDRKPNEQQVMI